MPTAKVVRHMAQDKKFIIGGFSFDTYAEYHAAQEDVKKIECINKELNVQDPEVALRLYHDIRDGIITFNSPIGGQFAHHVADIVAQKSAGLLDDVAQIEEAEGKAKGQRVVGLLFVSIAVVLIGIFAYSQVREIYQTRQIASLKDTLLKSAENDEAAANKNTSDADIDSDVSQDVVSDSAASSNTIEEDMISSPWDTNYNVSDLTILPEYQNLYNQNNDFVGWLEVVDTDINYPVMQTISDPEYYLRRNFNGEDDTNGTLFVDYRCDIVNATTNTIIYGHNMRSGKMFGGLKRYLDYDYYQSHKTIKFGTLYDKQEYEVVGVGLSEVGYNDDGEYKYYDFIDAVTGQELQEFLGNIQSLSVYDESIDIQSTDKILTLSTCNTYKENGRLFVVAKRVK